MANRSLLREFDLEVGGLFDELSRSADCPDDWYEGGQEKFRPGEVITGRVVDVVGGAAVVDVGYKSEGLVPLSEWHEEAGPPRVGDLVQVLLCNTEADNGAVVLSRRKAAERLGWERFLAGHALGDIVQGVVTRKVKGGLLVALEGIVAFLPASQIDLRRPASLDAYLRQEVACEIMALDAARRNLVVSRRAWLERQRAEARKKLLSEIEPGQLRQGVVRNIVAFGAFVDLGGIDGLLHVNDMAWGRVRGPHEVVRLDQQIEVCVIGVDRERERVSLGLKQKAPSPWVGASARYPVGSRHAGEVMAVTGYGAFVRLEPGVEGLVHISEVSTSRIKHPGELVEVGDVVNVLVLGLDEARQQASLSMKKVPQG